MLTTKPEIIKWLKKMGIKKYTINSDSELTVDVDGDVELSYRKLKEIPVQFGKVDGYFSCSNTNLNNLEGCPGSVGGSFYCSDNNLNSLEHCPSSVGGYFWCDNNNLNSLKGCPSSVGGYFGCYNNKLNSLEGCTLEQLLMLKDKYDNEDIRCDKGFNKLLDQALHKIKSAELNKPTKIEGRGMDSDIELV
jgi:hypothetical protein